MALSKREKVLITLLVVVGIGALLFNYIVFPLYEDILANRSKLKNNQLLLEELTYLEQGDAINLEKNTVMEDYKNVNDRIPDHVNLEQLYLDMIRLAEGKGLSIQEISFEKPMLVGGESTEESTSSLHEINFYMTLEGDFIETENFLQEVYALERDVYASGFEYEKTENGVRATIPFQSYAFMDPADNYKAEEQGLSSDMPSFGTNNPFLVPNNDSPASGSNGESEEETAQ
ncbi:MAG TPA: hypothetical protein DHN33_03570 [Eubacteriaceae bacterium]|nr:hypothetical protein [Eubacteriaceae bacterium]